VHTQIEKNNSYISNSSGVILISLHFADHNDDELTGNATIISSSTILQTSDVVICHQPINQQSSKYTFTLKYPTDNSKS